jgi:hypothetical protein
MAGVDGIKADAIGGSTKTDAMTAARRVCLRAFMALTRGNCRGGRANVRSPTQQELPTKKIARQIKSANVSASSVDSAAVILDVILETGR